MNESAFKPKRRAGNTSLQAIKLKAEDREEQLPETIQGQRRGSKEEARACVALGYLQIPFRYQVWWNGGSEFRGGLIIDILAETRPKPTPIFVQSRYWHGPTRKAKGVDAWNLARLRQRTQSYWADPLEVWDYQLTSIQQAIDTFVGLLGRGY